MQDCVLTMPRTINRALARLRLVPYTKLAQDAALALAREMQSESELHRDMPINEAKLVAQFETSISHPDQVYFKLCYREDEPLGLFLGFISPIFFTDVCTAKDLAWFVTKERRSTLAAFVLVTDFEMWAAHNGVHHITLGQSTGVRMLETRALYQRLGYTEIGSNNLKRI